MAAIPTALEPWLSVRGSAQAMDFYKAAFAATELLRIDGEDNGVIARLSIDGAQFWVAEESTEFKNFDPRTTGGSSVRMILSVTDPDAVFAAAIRAGATEVCSVKNDHGWRVGRVADPFGHHWEIARPIPGE